MTNDAKEFLALASKDEAIKNELKNAKDTETTLKIAESHGFSLSADDFTPSEMEELSEDELEAVAGGSFCMCNNAGSGGAHNLNCSCSFDGEGKDPDPSGRGFCICVRFGLGWN